MIYQITCFLGMIFALLFFFLVAFISPIAQLIFGRKIIVYIANLSARIALISMRIKMDVEGKIGDESRDKSYIIASKHTSWIDVLFTAIIFNQPATILKKSLLFIPGIYNWGLSSNFIFIDRSEKIKSMKTMLRKANKILNKKKKCILIFPEGTRTIKKQKIKSALFFLYKNLKCDVIPVAISAPEQQISTLRSLFCFKKRTIKIKIFDKIKACEIHSREIFEKTIENKINIYIK